jgi:hypothetical protein
MRSHKGPLDSFVVHGASSEDLRRKGAVSVVAPLPVPVASDVGKKTGKKKSRGKKNGAAAVAFDNVPEPKRRNDRSEHTSITMLAFVQSLLHVVGLSSTSAVLAANIFPVLTSFAKNGGTATFGEYSRVQEAIKIPESTARRWWKQYVSSCTNEGQSAWEIILSLVVTNPKDERSVTKELEKALLKANQQGRKSPLSPQLLQDLARLCLFASTTKEGLHWSRVVMLVQFLLVHHDESPMNKLQVPYKFGKSWATSYLYRENYVARAKTNSTGKLLATGVGEDHLLRGAWLVKTLKIRPADVCGLDEVPMKLEHSSGKTLAPAGAKEVLGGTKDKDNKAQITVVSWGYADGAVGIAQLISKGKTERSCPVPLNQDFLFTRRDRVQAMTAKGRSKTTIVYRHALDDDNQDDLYDAIDSGRLPIPFKGIENDNDMAKRPLLLSRSSDHWMWPDTMWENITVNVLAHRRVMDLCWFQETGRNEPSQEWMLLEMDDWYAHRMNILYDWLLAHRVAVNMIPPNGTKVYQAGDLAAHAPLHVATQNAFSAKYNGRFVELMSAAMAQTGTDMVVAAAAVQAQVIDEHTGIRAQREILGEIIRKSFYDTIGPGYASGFVKV